MSNRKAAPKKPTLFVEAAAEVLGIDAGTDAKLIGQALIENGHTMTFAVCCVYRFNRAWNAHIGLLDDDAQWDPVLRLLVRNLDISKLGP